MTTPQQPEPQNRKESQLPQSEAYLNRAWRCLGEALGPYVFRKTNDDSLKETRDVYVILSKMLDTGVWDSYFQAELDHNGRRYVYQLRDFRNSWAHQDFEGYDDNDVLHTLYSIVQLLRAIAAPQQADLVQQMHDELISLIAALGAPERRQPPSEYAQWQQEFQQWKPEQRQFYGFLMAQQITQPEISQFAAPHSPRIMPPQDDIAISAPAAPANMDTTIPLNPNIRQPDYFVYRGNAALNQQDYDHAIECYNRALALNPNLHSELNPRLAGAYNNRGLAYDNKGEYDQAIADYAKALELNPKLALAYNNRGNAHNNKGEYDQAIADYAKALELNQDYALAYYNRGNAYNNKGEYSQAIADYSKVLELNPDYVDAYYNRGNAYNNKGEYDQAIADYSKALELNPDDMDAYYNRGNTYANKGEYDQAIADYSKALELNPDFALAYNNRGIAYDNKGEYDQAIADYAKALELNPDFALAYNNRGVVYANKGEYDLAIADYAKALELNPDFALAYNNRGISYRNKGEYDQAIADFARALEVNPDYANAYNNRGVAYADKGEYDQAIADYAKALELDQNFAMAYRNRGNSYFGKGEYDQAIADYTKALELDPDDAESRQNLETATRLRNAATEYDQAIQENPQDPDVWHARGLHHLDDRQNYDQALADLTQALTLAPGDNPEIPYDRARAHFALGDYLAADADYTQAINRNDQDHIAWCERARAQQRLGNHRNAIADLDQALDPTRNPNYAPAYQLRSLSHAALGHRQEAQNDYEMWRTLESG